MAEFAAASGSPSTAEALYALLGPVFEELIRAGQGVELVSAARLILRFRFSAPTAELVLNCRKKPIDVVCGASPLRADLELAMPTATLHAILLGSLKLSAAVKSGGLKVKGDLIKLVRLGPVLDAAAKLYAARLAPPGPGPAGTA